MDIQHLMQIIQAAPSAMKVLLIHLDILGLVSVDNYTNPSLEKTTATGSVAPTKLADVETWIDDWRNLFDGLAPYKLSMGKGNKQRCIERMRLFTELVSANKARIFLATQSYIQDCIKHNRTSKMPEYFILPQSPTKISDRDIRTGDLYEWFNNQPTYKDISTLDV